MTALSLAGELAAEQGRLARLRSCLAAAAKDMQQRDSSFPRLQALCNHLFAASSVVPDCESAKAPFSPGVDLFRDDVLQACLVQQRDEGGGGNIQALKASMA